MSSDLSHQESRGKVSDNRQGPPCKAGEAQETPDSLEGLGVTVLEGGTRRGYKWKTQSHWAVMYLQVTWVLCTEPDSASLGWSP